VFATNNVAFAKLSCSTVDNLLTVENKAVLSISLTYQLVPGNFEAKAVIAVVKKVKGKVVLTNVAG